MCAIKILLCLLSLALFNVAIPAHSQVRIETLPDRISVEINGKPFTSLYKGLEAHKPFLYPLLTPSGKSVTRAFPMEQVKGEPTRPHQRSLWIGAEHLSGMDFWENDPTYHRPRMGTIVFKRVLSTRSGKSKGSFRILADWVTPNGHTIMVETLGITFYAKPKESRIFDIDLRLKATKQVTFEDDHDAILGMRLAPAFEEGRGSHAVNAEAITGIAQLKGKRSEWVDWQTNLDGEQIGVAVMDFPKNFHYPTPWHLHPEPLLFASPFAFRDYFKSAPDGSLTLRAGHELHMRYRIFIHPASVPVAPEFKEFAAQ